MRRIRIGVSGAAGRMGRRIVAIAAADRGLSVACALDRKGSPVMGKDAGTVAGIDPLGVRIGDRLAPKACDVLIDFSSPEGALRRIAECAALKVPLVVGTTGLGAPHRASLARAARRIPVLAASNTGLGANLLAALVERAARSLTDFWPDIEIVEAHHTQKVDAPSGTALLLAEAAERGAGRTYRRVLGRAGAAGPRDAREIGIHAVRAGRIVGEHTVLFAFGGERLELVHRAETRDVFAEGALAAARFLAGRRPGLYSMKEVLCLGTGSSRRT